MTNAWQDTGPTTPSKTSLYRRARETAALANIAADHAVKGDITRAIQYLKRAKDEASRVEGKQA